MSTSNNATQAHVLRAATQRPAGGRTNLFICFAPAERDFVRDLDEALRKRRRISAIDWQKVDAAQGTSPEVLKQIEATDTFVFVVSPASVAAPDCRRQLEHAARLRKVIVPVVRAQVAEQELPASLASLQAIDYRPSVEYMDAFAEVIKAINTNLRIDVFICYSRADGQFVKELYRELGENGRHVWLDLKSIQPSTLWENEIYAGIEAADNFIFVISPASLRADSFCHKELAHAHANNKRIIPLFHHAVADADIPPTLAQYQREDFPADGDFTTYFANLLSVLDEDPAYLREHTRLLTRALEWQRTDDGAGNKDKSLLLRGTDLTRAEELLRTSDKRPQFTNLQAQYVVASRVGANRTRNRWLTAAGVAVILMAVLSTLLFFQTRAARAATADAIHQQSIAEQQTVVAKTKEKEAIDAAKRERIARGEADISAKAARTARDQAEQRRVEAERQRQLAVEARDRERRQREEADIRRTLAEASRSEVADKPAEALALYRVAAQMQKSTGRPASSYEIEQAAKRTALARVLAVPGQPVHNLALSRDGNRLATAPVNGGKIDIWDVNTGARIQTVPAFDTQVIALAFSPQDNDLLAAAGSDNGRPNIMKLWHVERTPVQLSVSGEVGVMAAEDFQFSQDGKLLATGKAVVNVASRISVPVQIPPRTLVSSFALSHDAKTLALAFRKWDSAAPTVNGESQEDYALWLCDAATGADCRSFARSTAQASNLWWFAHVAFSHDDKYVAAATASGDLHVWTTSDGRDTPLPRTGGAQPRIVVFQLAFAPHSYQLVTTDSFHPASTPDAANDKVATISVWDVHERKLLKERLPAHDNRITSLSFSADGERFATGSLDRTTKLWDARTWEPLQTLKEHQAGITRLAFVPAAHDLLTGSQDGTARLWPLAEGQVTQRVFSRPLATTPSDQLLSFSADATRALLAHKSDAARTGPPSELAVYDTATGAVVAALQASHASAGVVTFAQDEAHVAFQSATDGSVRVWAAADGRLIGMVEGFEQMPSARFTPAAYSSDLLTVALTDKLSVKLKDLQAERSLLDMKLDDIQVEGIERLFNFDGVALSPDGKQFAVTIMGGMGQAKGVVLLWRRGGDGRFERQGRPIITERINSSLSFTADGRLLVLGGRDGRIRVLNTATMEPPTPSPAQLGPIHTIVHARTAHIFATHAGADDSVQVWRAEGALQRVSSIPTGGPVSGLVLSADGSRLITLPAPNIGAPGVLQVWNTQTGLLIDALGIDKWRNDLPLAFLPDAKRIALAGTEPNGFRVWVAQPFKFDPFFETGALFNLRACRDTHRVVPVLPFPAPDTVWASAQQCKEVRSQ
ncbi:MAG: TIR domain-containing protein [Pyrinomonadaceae bacterium]